MQNYSDAELVALYLESRGPQYLTELFTRHGNIVYRTALRIMKNSSDAEDILQTVYCKMITSLHLYKGTGSVIGWMLQIVIHTCYNQRQSEKSRINRDKKIMSERVQTVSPKNDELKEIMEAHLNKLPEIYKVPITLQIMEGLSIKEVSEALEIPEKTIRSQIARGLEKLKISLQNVGITASIIMIGDSLKQVPMPIAPASINSSAYFQSLIKNKTAASTKLAVTTTSKSFVIMKIVSFMIVASVSIATYLNWPISSNVTSGFQKVKQWDFENSTSLEEYQGVGVVRGAMAIEEGRGVDNSKCLKIAENSVIEFDISRYQLPIAISYDLDVLVKDSMVNQILFDEKGGDLNKKLPFFSGLRESLDIKPNQSVNKNLGFTGNWYKQIAYIDENSYDCWINGKRGHLLLGALIDNKKIYVSFNGKALVDNLKIESIDKVKVPDKSVFEKIASSHSYQKGVESYPIDKTVIGFDKNSSVKPTLKFISTALKKNTSSYSHSVTYPRIAENGKVEWSVKQDFKVNNWSFENNNELASFQKIELLKGDMQIVEKIGMNQSKALQINEESVIALNVSEYQFPIKVSYKFDISTVALQSTQRIFLIYNKNTEVKDLAELREKIPVATTDSDKKESHSFSGNWFTHEFYIDEMAVDFWSNGSREHLQLGECTNTNKIFLYIGGKSKIDDLEIRSIKKSEMPDRAVCEKIVSEIQLKDGVKVYDINKVALGLKANSQVTPTITFRSGNFFDENFDLHKATTLAILGPSKLVEWVKIRQKVSKKWDFEKFTELLDFKLVSGAIFFQKSRGENNSNCLAIDSKTIFSIDISEYQLPIKITLKYDIILQPNTTDNGAVFVKSGLSPEKNIFNFRNLSVIKLVDVSNASKINKNQNAKVGFIGQWMFKTIYVSEECVDIWFEGNRRGLIYQTSLDNKKLYYLNFDPTIVDSLAIETIERDQLPAYKVYKDYVATIPFAKGKRSVFPENKIFGLEINNKPEVDIYDREYLEENLGLYNNKPIFELIENKKSQKPENGNFPLH